MNHARNTSTAQIQSSLTDINKFVQNILKLLNSAGVDEASAFDIRLSLEEALINAAKHGNRNNENLTIKIDYYIADGIFKISIEDTGSGFDHKHLPDPTVKGNLLKTKGRGVYLIKHLMDEVLFNKSGNKITMIKYLRRANADKQN